jgi:hypothetical protein
MAGSRARAASRPNSSRLPRMLASAAGATGSCSRIGAISASGGSPPARNGKPARCTRSVIAFGPTTSVSCPRRSAAMSTGTSGFRWPEPPSEHAARMRTPSA